MTEQVEHESTSQPSYRISRSMSCDRSSAFKSNHEPLVSSVFSDVSQFYSFREELGRGAAGIVKRCVSRENGGSSACKTVIKSSLKSVLDVEDLVTEIEIHNVMQIHPYVLKLHEVHEDPVSVHMIMDYCTGGDLFERIKLRGCYPEHEAAIVCRKLASALAFAHKNGIVHRDLKPENVLLVSEESNTDVVLADFGAAATLKEGRKLNQLVGSPLYIAPTVLSYSYGFEADIWSLGVVLYVLLCGFPPFFGRSNPEIFRRILHEPVSFRYPRFRAVSDDAKDLIVKLLRKGPADDFLTAEQVLRHPWLERLGTVSAPRPIAKSVGRPRCPCTNVETCGTAVWSTPARAPRRRSKFYSYSDAAFDEIRAQLLIDREFEDTCLRHDRTGVLGRCETVETMNELPSRPTEATGDIDELPVASVIAGIGSAWDGQ